MSPGQVQKFLSRYEFVLWLNFDSCCLPVILTGVETGRQFTKSWRNFHALRLIAFCQSAHRLWEAAESLQREAKPAGRRPWAPECLCTAGCTHSTSKMVWKRNASVPAGKTHTVFSFKSIVINMCSDTPFLTTRWTKIRYFSQYFFFFPTFGLNLRKVWKINPVKQRQGD